MTFNLCLGRVTRCVSTATYSNTKGGVFLECLVIFSHSSTLLSAVISSCFFHILRQVSRLPECCFRQFVPTFTPLEPHLSSGFYNSFTSSWPECVFPPQQAFANLLGSTSLILTLIPIDLLRCQQPPPPEGSCFTRGCQSRCETGFITSNDEEEGRGREGANTHAFIFGSTRLRGQEV